MADDEPLTSDQLIRQIAEQMATKMLIEHAKALRPMLQFVDAAAAKLAFAEVSDEPERSRLIAEVRQMFEALSQDDQLGRIVAMAERGRST